MDLNVFHIIWILEIYFPCFLGYCGIQYQAYSATSPDSFVLDDTAITSVNVSWIRPHWFQCYSWAICLLTKVLYMSFWLLSHVIYLKLTRVIKECLLSQSCVMGNRTVNYTKKTVGHLVICQNWCFGLFYHPKIWKIEK